MPSTARTQNGRDLKETTVKVDFVLNEGEAKSVFLAGDFNAWQPEANPLRKDRQGLWKTSLKLKPGSYQYRFVVDGEWRNDPACDGCIPNPYGSSNCVKTVN